MQILNSNKPAVLLVFNKDKIGPVYAMATECAVRRATEVQGFYDHYKAHQNHEPYKHNTSADRCGVIEKYNADFYFEELPAESKAHAVGIVKYLRRNKVTEI
jgi:hypothetical protein